MAAGHFSPTLLLINFFVFTPLTGDADIFSRADTLRHSLGARSNALSSRPLLPFPSFTFTEGGHQCGHRLTFLQSGL